MLLIMGFRSSLFCDISWNSIGKTNTVFWRDTLLTLGMLGRPESSSLAQKSFKKEYRAFNYTLTLRLNEEKSDIIRVNIFFYHVRDSNDVGSHLVSITSDCDILNYVYIFFIFLPWYGDSTADDTMHRGVRTPDIYATRCSFIICGMRCQTKCCGFKNRSEAII